MSNTAALPPRSRRAGLFARAARWGAELVTVFVGVYAAFMLSSYQSHRQERQRREQILAWMDQQFTETLADVGQERAGMRTQADDFDRRLAAGEMPALHAFNFTSDYDPSDMASVLGGGGFDLLEVETIRQLKDTEAAVRLMIAVTRHDQQLSDALILPNLDKTPGVFYDPDSRQLRPAYKWYADFFKTFPGNFDALYFKTEKLVRQIRAERQRNR